MPTFYYKAKRPDADTVLGQIIAEDKEDAVEKIDQLGLVPIKVEEHEIAGSGPQSGAAPSARPRRVGVKQLFLFSRQLVNLLKAGIPILRALEVLAAQTKNAYFRDVIRNVRAEVQQGRSFSESLANYPRLFSDLYVTMVKAGEEGGTLKESISDVAVYLRRQAEISSKVRTAMAYPLLMALFGVGTVIFILTYVMPKITGMFQNLHQTLPLPTRIVMGISHFLLHQWWAILLVLFVLAGLVQKSLQNQQTRLMLDRMQLNMPFLGSLTLRVELARFTRTLELLLKSGTPIVRAITFSIPLVRSQLIRQELTGCREELVAGRSFGESLKKTRWVPEMVGHLVSVGEESGALADTLHDIAENYEQDIDEAIKVMTTLLEPLMIVVVGSIIGFIVIAMLLPIFQLDVFAQ